MPFPYRCSAIYGKINRLSNGIRFTAKKQCYNTEIIDQFPYFAVLSSSLVRADKLYGTPFCQVIADESQGRHLIGIIVSVGLVVLIGTILLTWKLCRKCAQQSRFI